jgi:GAF domain-containing protein
MVLTDVVTIARDNLPGADEVSITLLEDDHPITIASTGELATEMDERQYEVGWGPCLDAASNSSVLLVDDVRTDTRWPDYAEKAQEVGVGASLSAPLPTHQRFGGALNIYSRSPNAFDDQSCRTASSFAAHVALALDQVRSHLRVARQAETLQDAMRSRAVIEQAKGILMALHKTSADEAFELLVRMSQHSHVKLRDVAARLVGQVSEHPVSFDDP